MKQYKSDIKTIIEVSTFILIYFSFSSFVSQNSLIGSIFFVVWIVFWIYNLYTKIQYSKGNPPDILIFSTLNDNYSKMTFMTLGIMASVISIIGYFAFSFIMPYLVVGLTVGIIIFLNGLFDVPKGWITIENNSLKIYGVQEEIDSRQLKEIELKNDQIILTNIYGEHKKSNLLNLTPIIAKNIKHYITERLHNNEVLVVNNVS
jgi:hypothetical protein